MKPSTPYPALIPIINQTLFGYADIDEYFMKNEKLIFSNFFTSYHKQFLEDPAEDKHEWLLTVLFEYCEETTYDNREALVKIMMDNEFMTRNIILMSSLKVGQSIDFDQAFEDFNLETIKFLDKGILTPEIGIFFALHFRNFEDIELKEYSDYELDKTEYNRLISQYLKRQTNFKFT